MPGEGQVVVDLDEQVRQHDSTHVRREPGLQSVENGLARCVELLGGVRREPPAFLAGDSVAVGGCRNEEAIVGLTKAR